MIKEKWLDLDIKPFLFYADHRSYDIASGFINPKEQIINPEEQIPKSSSLIDMSGRIHYSLLITHHS